MLETQSPSARTNDRMDFSKPMEGQESETVLPLLPKKTPQENLPSTVSIGKRSTTSLATIIGPVVIPNFPNIGNTCFVNASMQYLASFIDEMALVELQDIKPPTVFPNRNPDESDESESTKNRLRIEAWFKARESFCTLITDLNTHQSTIRRENAQAFIDFVCSYTLLSKSQSAGLFFRDAETLFDKMLSPDMTLNQFTEMQRPKLRQQDSTEFMQCIRDMFSLDDLPSLKETTRFTYKQTVGIELEEGVCIKNTRVDDHNTTLLLDLALPSSIHMQMPEGDLSDALAADLSHDSRKQRVEKKEAEQAYVDAKKTFPSTYDEEIDRNCHLATSLCVPSSFERLLIRLGVFQYDYQTGGTLKRSDEATQLVAKSNGFISLAGILEYQDLLEDADKRANLHGAKNSGEITAILCHAGNGANNGHYMTLRKINKVWYIFDDQAGRSGCTLETYLKAKPEIQVPPDCLAEFGSVAIFLQYFADPYAITVDIVPLPLTPAEVERSRSGTPASLPDSDENDDPKFLSSTPMDVDQSTFSASEFMLPTSKKIKTSDGSPSLPDNDEDNDDCVITKYVSPSEALKNTKLNLSSRKRKRSN